ncbi:MAG: zinc dependent phospholipase C family protein [Bacilli bacterium]
MPNVWTHIQFGRKVVDQIGFSTDLDLKPFFQLGTQGPDPFFYHNFWPWKKDKSVSAIGSAIHYRSCGAFLMDMIDYGKCQPKNNKLRAYILGFMTHHILDRNAHPYIIYRSGNEGTKHTKLETIIDTLIRD